MNLLCSYVGAWGWSCGGWRQVRVLCFFPRLRLLHILVHLHQVRLVQFARSLLVHVLLQLECKAEPSWLGLLLYPLFRFTSHG